MRERLLVRERERERERDKRRVSKKGIHGRMLQQMKVKDRQTEVTRTEKNNSFGHGCMKNGRDSSE